VAEDQAEEIRRVQLQLFAQSLCAALMISITLGIVLILMLAR
jgi:hypothetical protein